MANSWQISRGPGTEHKKMVVRHALTWGGSCDELEANSTDPGMRELKMREWGIAGVWTGKGVIWGLEVKGEQLFLPNLL